MWTSLYLKDELSIGDNYYWTNMNTKLSLLNLGLTLVITLPSPVQAEDLKPDFLYKQYCSGCHGAQLDGGLASALIKDQWQYGRDDFSIGNVIRYGIPGTSMVGWNRLFDDQQIDALADYIIDAQGKPPIAEPIPENLQTEDYSIDAEIMAALDTPWAMEFVDNRRALITENNIGSLHWLIDGEIDPTPVTGIPEVDRATSTGGLMDIALDPKYEQNGWVYLSISHSENPDDVKAPGMTRIIRGRIKNHQWVDNEYLFKAPEEFHLGNSKHWGGRLLFDKQGYLYFSIGDMSQPMFSQELEKPPGKVYRINPDGSIPEDNPYAKNSTALGAIFTIGNRNVQGMAQHPVTSEIWATEHGPLGGDELNKLVSGNNYGWPLTTYGVNYDGTSISEHTHMDGITPPVTQWTPGIVVSPIEFVTGDMFSKWQNNLLLGTLAFEELRRLVIVDEQIVKQETLVKGYGRIRDIKIGPDHAIYILTNSPGSLIRLSIRD